MKKTFLAKRNALLAPSDLSWGAVALAFVLLLFLVRVIAPAFFLDFTAPLFGIGSGLAIEVQGVSAGFAANAALVAQNNQLESENAALTLENKTLAQQAADLGAFSKMGGQRAAVLARPPESPYDTLVIALGSAKGVSVGDGVFGPAGTPLGTISSVSSGSARVTLFSAPGATTDAWVGAAHIPVTLVGAGGGAFSASVPRAAAIAVGDIVALAGPGAVPVGVVSRLDGDPASPTLNLRIVPAVNIFSLTWVSVAPGL